MNLQAHFLSRNMATRIQPTIPWQVKSCSWSALGGCQSARLVARVGAAQLWELADLLRCGLDLYDAGGNQAWWGYVHAVSLRDGKIGARVSLDSLANQVRVAYGLHAPGLQGSGARQNTPWAADVDSQAVYGIKEAQLSLDLATSTQALAYRSAELARRSRPTLQPIFNPQPGGSVELELEGRGWFETLDWRYVTQPAGLVQYTAEGSGVQPLGDLAANIRLAQSFTPASGGWRMDEAWALVRVLGTPSDALTCQVCADAAGAPGTLLASATPRAGASLNGDFRWEAWQFPTPFQVTSGALTWLVFARSGGLDSANAFRFRVNQDLGYANGVLRMFGGATWAARSPDADLLFRVDGTQETTAQIAQMAAPAAVGQFLAGVRIDTASGIYTNPFRYGDRRGLEEIKAHLAAGTAAGLALLAEVTPERILRITTQPAPSSVRFKIGQDGRITTLTGALVPVHLGSQVVGSWAVLDAAWNGQGTANAMLSERVWIEALGWSGGELDVTQASA